MREVTCDRCGVGISPDAEPAELKLGSHSITFDLCVMCAHGLRMDFAVKLEEWREKIEEEQEVEANV
jgi:hypothetical protein